MAKSLEKAQIEELLSALREYFGLHIEFRNKYATAAHIQFPKTPSLLSEAIILNLLKQEKVLKELNISEAKFGGKKADILVMSRNKELKIEVKATGESAFQYFGSKDIVADYLIWVHFNRFFAEKELLPVEIFVLKNPNQYFKNPRKITLKDFKKVIPEQYTFYFDKIYSFK